MQVNTPPKRRIAAYCRLRGDWTSVPGREPRDSRLLTWPGSSSKAIVPASARLSGAVALRPTPT
eukprot:2796092-Pleurochrysis_carterae.AAC.2